MLIRVLFLPHSIKEQQVSYSFVFSHKSLLHLVTFYVAFFFFLSLRVFGLLSSSLFLFPQRFSRYVLSLSSGVFRTWEPTRNFKLRPLLKDTQRNSYRFWFPKLLRRQSSNGCRFNPDYRRVTVQEYLTLVPDYG